MENLIAPEFYNLTEEIEQFAGKNDKKLALKYVGPAGTVLTLTYDQLIKRANKLANGLLNLGLEKGDRILIMMPRSLDTYVAYIAALKAGMVIVPSSEMLRPNDLSYRLNHSEARAIIAHEILTEQIEMADTEVVDFKIVLGKQPTEEWLSFEDVLNPESDNFTAAKTKSDEMAFISYTSGTTGHPKGVVHTHSWAFAHIRTTASQWLDIQPEDTVWATAGPGWAKWLWSPFLATLGSGATGFLYNAPFDPERYLALIQAHKINVLCCTPTEYRLMAKSNALNAYDLKHLRSAVSAGEPLNREVIDIFQKQFNLNVRDGYGQTENTLLVGIMKDMELRPGSMGKPTPGNRVEIITEDGDAADVGEVGDIAVHVDTPALFKRYYKDEERTKKSRRGNYYLTGDRARKDQNGYFWFEGRSDDIIISSGYTIGPFEVEDALIKHPKVKECAVVASPDPDRGAVVKAFVILQNPKDQEDSTLINELQDHVKTLTAPYKYPRKIEFVEDLPKTTSGKIRRVALRDKEYKEKA
ncbi:acetyl-CoA synthetase [Pullulanibacillus pueri]|uniref:Acyl--CoA ligase n=1 Tax=Pullulanibacillus pueri TaxID=1437324 RepID=A0A8J2ZYD4_9BACL|nr:acyl--CoA ligase [Pullulanibacillus pueri]MBM7683502.1 acetyl-CoA synthetase [Pullulanibacillus pueri]GGH86675.1 acyl--CoA ligase [Pullulanibacillus pueri]